MAEGRAGLHCEAGCGLEYIGASFFRRCRRGYILFAGMLSMRSIAKRNGLRLDDVYIRILEVLQGHGRISNYKLAETVALSASPVHERVKKLESSGVVLTYTADIDLRKICQSIMIWAEVSLESYAKSFRNFDSAVAGIPEIVESYRVTGSADYLMRFVCADLDAYSALSARMMAMGLGVARIETRVVMERSKPFCGYPLRVLTAYEPPSCLDDKPAPVSRTLTVVRRGGA
jgi:Lrp/AsnC family leucine-responsive transcriptional regulator